MYKPYVKMNYTAPTCWGCGSSPHPGGRQQCAAANCHCKFCKKIGHLAKVCKGRSRPPYGAMAVCMDSPNDEPSPEVNASHLLQASFELAPIITLNLSSLNGQATHRGPVRFRDRCISRRYITVTYPLRAS